MKAVYQNQYRLKSSDFDRWNRLYPRAVLELFQDVAEQHAKELGIALGQNSGTELIWVLAKTMYRVVGDTSCRNVSVCTWPHKPNGVNFRRDYIIKDECGTPIIKGTSDWVVVHAIKRKIVIIKDLYPFEETEFCTDSTFEGKLPRLNVTQTDSEAYTVHPGFTDIDVNNHVNNTKYADFVLNSINPSKHDIIDTFRIDYHKEILCGEKVNLYNKHEDSTVYTLGKNDTGENLFTCQIKWK